MKNFLKAGELELKNGGYLVSTVTGEAVYNQEFVLMQEHAHYLVTFAKHAKGKNFEGKKADTISDVINAVQAELATKTIQFVETSTIKTGELTNKLRKEALAFINNTENNTKVDKINKFLQSFTKLQEFEDFGLFFTEDVVKLNKIYTVAEIVKTVTSVIDLVA